jgi:hypothetical protein
VRQDGTRSYFFTVDQLADLLTQAGFEVIEQTCVKKKVVNRKEQSEMSRRFVQVRARAVSTPRDTDPTATSLADNPAPPASATSEPRITGQ